MLPNTNILSYAIPSQKANYTTPIALQVREKENIDLRPGSDKTPQYPPFNILIVGCQASKPQIIKSG